MSYRNDRTERARLYKLWVTIEDRPCNKCSSRTQRQIAHIIPYHKRGKTTEDNCRVLCRACNLLESPSSKFTLGDRVILNGRTPQSIGLARHRPRTVVKIEYDPQHQCNYYTLGSNGRGETADGQPLDGFNYGFRSYMLLRPRAYHFKRRYIRHNQLQSTCDPQETAPAHQDIPKVSAKC